MITVANRIFVNPEYAEAFEKRFQNRAGLVDEMPGIQSQPGAAPHQRGRPLHVVLTYWESHEAFRAWVESDAFKQGHAQSGSLPKEAFTGRNVLEVHQVIQDSREPGMQVEEPLELESPH